jgi:hypothetical protein
MMLAPIAHISPLTLIRKDRVLPVPGRVVVRQGQKVAPRDVIAEANLAPEHVLLHITRGLGVSIEQADNLIQCTTGEHVNAGDLIAGPVGIARRVVRSPISGQIMLVGEGQVLIQVDKPLYELHAGISGTVTQLISEYGAVIETTGCLIQGHWGNGRADFGLMQSKLETPTDELTTDHIDVSLRGSVVLGGHCKDPAVLDRAANIPIRGLVLASMSSALVPAALSKDFPILVLEGFGPLPLNIISFNLLTNHQNREISVNAEPFDAYSGKRPEVIITLPSSRELDSPGVFETFAVGQRVRIMRAPYQSKTGTLELLYNGLTEFPSGIRAPGAQIALEDGESVKAPLANLEVIN